MEHLKGSHFVEDLTEKVHLRQYDGVYSIKLGLTRRTLEGKKL
jgi:hypothetical protein